MGSSCGFAEKNLGEAYGLQEDLVKEQLSKKLEEFLTLVMILQN